MKKVVRSALATITMTAAITTTSLLTAPEAGAINRLTCPPFRGTELTFFSNQTTCWANPGGISVTLLGVLAYGTGNWAGCFNHQGGTVGYLPGTAQRISQTRVDFIFISSSGSGSTVPCRV